MHEYPSRDEKGRVLPGHSLNIKGKPKGRLSDAGKLRKALAAELPQILNTLVSLAKQGDVQACRIILDRVLPPLRAEASLVTVPDFSQATGLLEKAEVVLEAVAQGELNTDAGIDLISALGHLVKLKEIDDLELRIAKLEGNSHAAKS